MDRNLEEILLVRNIRGNWTSRFLHEYHFKHKGDGNFYFLNLMDFQVLPPMKSSPTFIKATWREWLSSNLFFKNPLPVALTKSMKLGGVKFLSTNSKLSAQIIPIIIKLFCVKDSNQLNTLEIKKVPYGKFLHTTLIAKYGVKHFPLDLKRQIRNFRLYYRFLRIFLIVNKKIQDLYLTRIVIINGRDVAGTAVQLSAYLNDIPIVTLEAGFGNHNVPLYGEWKGNMHHWYVRQKELESTMSKDSGDWEPNEFIESKYGLKSKWWTPTDIRGEASPKLPRNFVSFFTTSEKETTCCPTGIPELNIFDNFDQVEQMSKVYYASQQVGVHFVIRLHPNFTNNRHAINELKFFRTLTKEWPNCILIPNNSKADSYKIARSARLVFTFRSSLSAEFSRLGIRCIQTAPTAWSQFSIGQPITEVVDLIRILRNPEKYFKYSVMDWRAFASYYALHGKRFESILIEQNTALEKVNSPKLIQMLDGVQLDIPRFKFKVERN